MIKNVADLKNRTLVESNTLKQFILASGSGLRKPDRDDILIHDFQIANSVTLNSLLSNYIVNLQYAWDLIDAPEYGTRDSYFEMMSKLEESDVRALADETRLILEVDDGMGSFKSKKLDYDVMSVEYDENTERFLNLDAIWYGVVLEGTYHQLKIAKGMNDFFTNPNPWGADVNPFDMGLNYDPTASITGNPATFNLYLKARNCKVNSIIENKFYKNRFNPEGNRTQFGNVIPLCKYLVCLSDGLYGLQPQTKTTGGKEAFDGFKIYKISSIIDNLEGNYDFQFCGFHVVSDWLTLFVVFKDTKGDSHYFYLNDESYDELYGFTTVTSLVVDQLIVNPEEVFTKVDSIKTLDAINVLMTDYGFWDIEPNQTSNITYSFRGDKDYNNKATLTDFNGHVHKLLPPVNYLPLDNPWEDPWNDSAGAVRGVTYPSSSGNDKVVEYDKIWQEYSPTSKTKKYKCKYVGNVLTSADEEHPGHSDYPEYLSKIYTNTGADPKPHPFVGGTEDFAVYDVSEDGEPVNILVHITQDQFNSTLFSNPQLVNPFISWLYDKVVHSIKYGTSVVSPDTSAYGTWEVEKAEYYLWNKHGNFATKYNQCVTGKLFPDNEYQVVSTDGLISATGKFKSITNIVTSERGGTAPSTLMHYCDTLQTLKTRDFSDPTLNESQRWDWLVEGGWTAARAKIVAAFQTAIYPGKKDAFIDEILDVLVSNFSLLGYFRSYLKTHLQHDLNSCAEPLSDASRGVVVHNLLEVVENIRTLIINQVQTTLVLGGYSGNCGSNNGNQYYPNLGSYIYQNVIWLNKADIQNIMSATNMKAEVVSAVKSTNFFNEYDTYGEMQIAVADATALSNMFLMSYNADFIEQGLLADHDKIRVVWDVVKGWLFPSGGISQSEVLRAFIRTQFYRALYFNPTDYVTFTTDHNVYQCSVNKFYINHKGVECPLEFQTGFGPGSAEPKVDKARSQMNRVACDNFDIDRISYLKLNNWLEYYLNYDKIQLDGNNTFVFDDIEYFAVIIDNKVNALYFNEFQKELQAQCDQVTITDGNKFVLNKKEYTLEKVDGILYLKVNSATSVFGPGAIGHDPAHVEFKTEIVNDKFKIDGIRYALEKEGDVYKRLKYAGVDDNLLTRLDVTTEGYATYPKWSLEFQFVKSGSTINWKQIYAYKRYQTPVIDRVSDEWCFFDGPKASPTTYTFGTDKTFEWYLANEIIRIRDSYSKVAEINNLRGILYSGELDCHCTIKLVNDVRSGDVVTQCVLSKTVGGETKDELLGDFLDRELNETGGRVIRGTMGADGIITPNASGDYAFIMKDVDGGKNNINTAWLKWDTWKTSYTIPLVKVGNAVVDEETGAWWSVFDPVLYDLPAKLDLHPIFSPVDTSLSSGLVVDEDEEPETYISGYIVTYTSDGSQQYQVKYYKDEYGNDGKYLHVIAKGVRTGKMLRYRIDLGGYERLVAGTTDEYETVHPIELLVTNDVLADTVGFSTTYGFEQLKQNLLTNVKQFMMNDIVSQLMNYNGTSLSNLTIAPDGLNLFLDLFSDSSSLDSYMAAQSNLPDQNAQDKYEEVYKNHLKDIDESGIFKGNLYKYLKQQIWNTFGAQPQIKLVDIPSIEVKRVIRTGDEKEDTFTYRVYLDIYLMQNKEMMNWLRQNYPVKYDEKFIIGNAVIKEVECTVEMVPKFNGSTMQYVSLYTVVGKSYKVNYDQIYYNRKKKTKHKAVELSEVTYTFPQKTYPSSGSYSGLKATSSLPTELVSTLIQNDTVFTTEFIRDTLIGINNTIATGTLKTVDIDTKYNTRESGGVWNLGVAAPTASSIVDGKLTSVDYGHTLIKGDVYDVKEVFSPTYSCTLKQATGSKTYQVVEKLTHDWKRDLAGNITDEVETKTVKVAYGAADAKVTRDYLQTYFTLGTVGSGSRKMVYLDYKPAYRKYATADISKTLTITSANLLSRDKFNERYSGAMTECGVAGATLPTTNLNFRVLERSNAPNLMSVGQGLDPGQVFVYEFSDDATIAKYNSNTTFSKEFDFSGLVQQTDEEGTVIYDNFWIGVGGRFRVDFCKMASETERHIVVTPLTPAYEVSNLPGYTVPLAKGRMTDVRVFDPVAETLYTKEGGIVVEKSTISEDVDPGEEGEESEGDGAATITKEVIRIQFQIRVDVKSNALVYPTGINYVEFNTLVTGSGSTPTAARTVLPICDFKGLNTGELNFGWVSIPNNLDKDPETKYDLTWLNMVLINWNSSLAFTTGAIDVPNDVVVLAPGVEQKQDGEIYNRQYQVEQEIKMPVQNQLNVPPSELDWTDDWNAGKRNFWMDKASTLKSIRAKITNHAWRKLMYNTSTPPRETDVTETSAMPYAMREKIKSHVFKTLALDDEYFGMILRQMMSFLDLIRGELVASIPVANVRQLCNFKYDYKANFRKHSTDKNKWMFESEDDAAAGLFGYRVTTIASPDTMSAADKYTEGVQNLNAYLKNLFFNDYNQLSVTTIPQFNTRDYREILVNPPYSTAASIFALRTATLEALYALLGNTEDVTGDLIYEIYGGYYTEDHVDLTNLIRYMNAIRTDIYGSIKAMFVIDERCNLLSKTETGLVKWHQFEANKPYMSALFDNKWISAGEYTYSPYLKWTDYKIEDNASRHYFKMLNRDLSKTNTTAIEDTFVLMCYDEDDTTDPPRKTDMLWYVSSLDAYVYSNRHTIKDMVYEQNMDQMYVLFEGDDYLYRYDHLGDSKDFNNKILLKKELATMKIETFHSVLISDHATKPTYEYLYLDYHEPDNWEIRIYGKRDGKIDVEIWKGSPGSHNWDFKQYNNILFGDSLFDESQLRFQNISKNKDMFDILDIYAVDDCYYGLFKDDSVDENGQTKREKYGHDIYSVFRCKPAKDGGTVQKLPYEIIHPHIYQTADQLYSLYVIIQTKDEEEGFWYPQLQEISVPDVDLYANRTINIYDILQKYSREPGSTFSIDNRTASGTVVIKELLTSCFKLMNTKGYFFALTNKGFFKVFYKTVLGQVSIDTLDDLKTALAETLKSYVIKKHMDQKHHGDQAEYFDVIAAKVNQYSDGFTPFQLIPTEFDETQDIGVIPDSPVDDTDQATDHRSDSIQVSTDIMQAGGMFAYTDTNPGIITAGVSNPATTYDDDQVFPKSQRNPSLEGSEFYDFIYDQKGNTLMDLYAIPFIYIINSNNTYDLYINIPTTRTKYLNRIAGTLKENGTTQVLADDTRTRRNFGDEAMANNLDESTTKLRIYIDKKYISIGNVELVEISGNSIPLQIYRDVPNNGFYDSIALESRWTGEVTEIDEPSKDINKVMLEFECYGTDSQSIHIQGKTLINRALDDRKYKFG